ncbi:hypothetical protein [Lacrimispora aerotolerans]|jgi:hypothetical protein|uniref:hypothetical protein n=1 Tax=Lacrimispora aerotolerans TaxID=36832 RepID=UPI0012ECA814|nr:hypothetical protein [Lacrimispora aerotolerans]
MNKNHEQSNVKQGFTIPEDNRVKLQVNSKSSTNCSRPGGFLWGSNGKSSCTC